MMSSGPEQEVPAADEEMPAGPQPEREQHPPPDGIAHDHAEDVAEGGDAGHPGQGEPLPGEHGAEQDDPYEIADERMLCHANLPAVALIVPHGTRTPGPSPARHDQNASLPDAPRETLSCVGLAGPSGGGTVEEVRSWRAGPGRRPVAPDPGDVSPSGVLGRRLGGQSDDDHSTQPSCPAVRPRLSRRRAACCG